MLEIRFHGRGGQGTVVASILMAKAFFKAGYYVQSFPFFGVERRGAPLEAYLRLDRKKIFIRTNVYTPDHIIVLDHTLLSSIEVTSGLKPGGVVLINTDQNPDEFNDFSAYRLALVNAAKIALKNNLGTRTYPIVNTALMGALAKVLEMPPVDAIAQAIMDNVPAKPTENLDAAKEAFASVIMRADNDSK